MKLVSIQDLKPQLSSIVAEAESGAIVLITRHGKPVAQLGPPATPHTRYGRLVGERWPPAVTSGLGARALAALRDDRDGR
jgi:prevent-host-death family protein